MLDYLGAMQNDAIRAAREAEEKYRSGGSKPQEKNNQKLDAILEKMGEVLYTVSEFKANAKEVSFNPNHHQLELFKPYDNKPIEVSSRKVAQVSASPNHHKLDTNEEQLRQEEAVRKIADVLDKTVRPVTNFIGGTIGAIIGGTALSPTVVGIAAGGVAGGALGYAGADALMDGIVNVMRSEYDVMKSFEKIPYNLAEGAFGVIGGKLLGLEFGKLTKLAVNKIPALAKIPNNPILTESYGFLKELIEKLGPNILEGALREGISGIIKLKNSNDNSDENAKEGSGVVFNNINQFNISLSELTSGLSSLGGSSGSIDIDGGGITDMPDLGMGTKESDGIYNISINNKNINSVTTVSELNVYTEVKNADEFAAQIIPVLQEQQNKSMTYYGEGAPA